MTTIKGSQALEPQCSKARWQAADIALLRDLYPELYGEDVAILMGRSVRSIYNVAAALGLRKSAEFEAADRLGRAQTAQANPAILRGQFKRGLVPWNMGIKGSTGLHPNSRATQFKPGTKPVQTQPLGSLRIAGNRKKGTLQLQIKLSDECGISSRRWFPVSRVVWEKANGPVPAGHIVVFKDGKSSLERSEITIDKLECITRAEHARRNHPWSHNPELGSLLQLKGAITRQVRRIAKEAAEAAVA